jgi:hypothetical protein
VSRHERALAKATQFGTAVAARVFLLFFDLGLLAIAEPGQTASAVRPFRWMEIIASPVSSTRRHDRPEILRGMRSPADYLAAATLSSFR